MKARWRLPVMLLAVTALFWLLLDAREVRQAVGEGLALCTGSVIPALFPFLCVSSLLMALGFGELAAGPLGGLMALYGLDGPAASALLLGVVGGYPIGARTAAELVERRLLTREEGERLLTFCNNSNPVFLISVLGAGVFGNVRLGIWLWLIHVLSALLTGLLFRSGGSGQRRCVTRKIPFRAVSLPSAVVTAVGRALSGMLSVCAFVVLFYVLASPLRELGGWLGALLVGTVELFSLTPLLPPTSAGFLLAAFCTGWGGLSVLCQTAAVLDGTDLSLRTALLGKLLQGAFSALLASAIILLF